MKKILLIPDSFKGTMSSAEICAIMERTLLRHQPQLSVLCLPVADGGEGSVEAFLAAVGGTRVEAACQGPYGEEITGFFGRLPDGTAVVEMAAAAGLPLVEDRLHAGQTTTYGVGQLILAAVESGAKKIILGLGGSATNDGGVGAACALGVRFLDQSGTAYLPTGDTLDRLAHIDMSGLCPGLNDVKLVTMCDIDNPLCGPAGASLVFGPQKGASPAETVSLDNNLRNLARVIQDDLGKDILDLPGAGAAGGMGGGSVAFLDSRLQMGIDTVLDTVGFDRLLEDADLVLTGEGRLDTQSLRGKVVIGVAARAKKAKVPVVAVVGDIGDDIMPAYDLGVSAIFSINRVAVPFSQAKPRSRSDMELTVDNLARFLGTLGLL